ncbi:LOW QUALITY PROTEIN: WD repeat-containing protein 73 [Thalassophryne amazonica]|uniref:LOW QUALITY PROTEIN: WD repeat-containing protein 73 n=1 Tax=Thalassophryne amazonica TaxID=390379 RepID=UPI001472504D|nr:LOW QUALITY PROTEIN: WD repeat-containing protein 73 [Thalassophryne amazonica]
MDRNLSPAPIGNTISPCSMPQLRLPGGGVIGAVFIVCRSNGGRNFDDLLDDWFIESLKSYTDLHVYQLDRPTRVIEWTSDKTVCVAGYSSSKNDIFGAALPLKLFADENKGLCAERDFKVVHGWFLMAPVHCLRHVPGTRCVVTNDGLSNSLQVWELDGDDIDVIRRTGSIEGSVSDSGRGSRIAARLWSRPEVLHGAESGAVQLTALATRQTTYRQEMDSSDPLSSLQFVSDTVFLTGCCNGSFYLTDTRTSAPPQLSPPPVASRGGNHTLVGTCSLGPSSSELSCRVVRLSSSGQAVVSDLRRPGGTLCQVQLDVQTRHCNIDDVTVSWAPVMDNCIAVSGFNGAVQIYDTSAWRVELHEAKPLFQHHGHVVSPQCSDDGIFITSHVWHPERRRTLLSAASDGSVHVWDWVDQSAADASNSHMGQ